MLEFEQCLNPSNFEKKKKHIQLNCFFSWPNTKHSRSHTFEQVFGTSFLSHCKSSRICENVRSKNSY